MGKTILFVDDEKQILKSLKRLFLPTDYQIFLAETGENALDILAKNKIDLVITDMRMPNMNGYQLLKVIKEKYPTTLRMILSGYAHEVEVLKALQDGSSKIYLLKPWDNKNLLKIIEQLFLTKGLLENKKLLKIINSIEDLPVLNTTYYKVCSLIEKEADMKEIATTIEADPSIASRVLRIVNSAFYGIQTGSIHQCITYLGSNNIKNIILTSSVFDLLDDNSNFYFNKGLLWDHASMTNKIVTLIYNNLLNKRLPDICNAAGLLHNIGQFVLIKNFKEEYKTILKLSQENIDIPINLIEKKVLGICHQEIGGYLLNWWSLPNSIIEAALYHHSPLDEKVIDKQIVCAVHIASNYSWHLLKPNLNGILEPEAFRLLNITEKQCQKIVDQL